MLLCGRWVQCACQSEVQEFCFVPLDTIESGTNKKTLMNALSFWGNIPRCTLAITVWFNNDLLLSCHPAMTTRLLRRALCLWALLSAVSHLSYADSHADPSAPEPGVTFSHVYKIDMPGSSSCKLESPDQTGYSNQIQSVKPIIGNHVLFPRELVKT